MMNGTSNHYGDQMTEENLIAVDFEPIREIWNKYRLENGTIIRHKFSLAQVFKNSTFKENVFYDVKLANTSDVDIVPTRQESAVTEPVIVTQEDLLYELPFTPVFNKPQVYELEDKIWIFIAEQVSKIHATKKIDKAGRPVYNLQVDAKISIYKPE